MRAAKTKKSRAKSSAPRDDAALKRAVLEAALPHLAPDGFTDKTLKEAAAEAEVDRVTLLRLFPREGLSLVEAFSDWADGQMESTLRKAKLSEMKIRERIKAAVNDRISALRPHKEAARRAAAFLTLPQNAPTAMTLLYRTVDRMWRAAGDASTDFNFYTKRAIIAGVYSSTLLRWFSDDSEDEKATFEFLDRRIDDVMRFEKFKADANEMFSKLPSFGDLLNRVGPRSSHHPR